MTDAGQDGEYGRRTWSALCEEFQLTRMSKEELSRIFGELGFDISQPLPHRRSDLLWQIHDQVNWRSPESLRGLLDIVTAVLTKLQKAADREADPGRASIYRTRFSNLIKAVRED